MQNVNSHAVLDGAWARPTRNSLSLIAAIAVVFATGGPLCSVTLAQSNHAASDCDKVGGAFVTNFIASDQTAGTATGDLKGAIGVKVLKTVSGTPGDGKPVVLSVQHFWVTETGDTLFLEPAEVTAYPGTSPKQPLVYSFVYEHGGKLTGGTGKFEGAAGSFKFWGALDLETGEVVGRYAGTVCLKTPAKP